jgi:hypothetical protein
MSAKAAVDARLAERRQQMQAAMDFLCRTGNWFSSAERVHLSRVLVFLCRAHALCATFVDLVFDIDLFAKKRLYGRA